MMTALQKEVKNVSEENSILTTIRKRDKQVATHQLGKNYSKGGYICNQAIAPITFFKIL